MAGDVRTRFWLASAALLAMIALFVVGSGTAGGQVDPTDPVALDPDGRWGPVEDWPMVAIHAALTSSGGVLTYGTDPGGTRTGAYVYDVWTPGPSAITGHATRVNDSGRDFFCNLQLNQAETGDTLLFGGDEWTASGGEANDFIDRFDPTTGAITPLPGMNRERWYGTGTTLGDGSFYVQGGTGGFDRPEIWTAERGAELLPFYTFGLDIWYPRNFLLSDGRIFGFDVAGKMYTIPADLSRLDRIGYLQMAPHARGSAAVMFEPDKILQFGGDTTRAQIIDLTSGSPVVTTTGSMAETRAWVNGVLLPDGRVLAVGGADKDAQIHQDDPIDTYGVHHHAEIWDPATGEWTTVAANAEERLYHATALLLPDGRVLSAGGGRPGPVINATAELYEPDYLVAADGSPTTRPTITTVSPTAVEAGDALTITVDRPADIERVTLVKSGAATHSFDMDQRFLELDPTIDADTGAITATLPSAATEIPPGTYLLTVLDGDGIPSISELITVTAPTVAPPPSPPPAPPRVTIGDAVVDLAGEGVEGVKVDLFTSNDRGQRLTFLEFTRTDSQGNYGFAVDTGCYAVTFIAPEGSVFANGGRFLNRFGCFQAGDAVTQFDATVVVEGTGAAALGGTVAFADGTPAEFVKVDLFTSNANRQRLEFLRPTTTGADGSYEFELSSPGCYVATMVAPTDQVFLNGSRFRNNWVCVGEGESNLDVDGVLASPAVDSSITGTVTDGAGPVAGVKIDLFQAAADGSRGTFVKPTWTAEDGTYSFDGFTGCYVLTFIAPDGRTFTNGRRWHQPSTCLTDGETVSVDAVLAGP